MATLKTSTVTEQTAAHLREELRKGRWSGLMPGRHQLARELGVSHNTVQAALDMLEAEQLLLPQGIGRRRRIAHTPKRHAKRSLRVRILLYDPENRHSPHSMELLDELHLAGFEAHFARKTLQQLGMDPQRVARFVGQTPADAWVVVAGSREVLAWFAAQPIPSLALFGRFSGLPIAAASPRAADAVTTAVRRLVSLGHRRIVMLAREERRKPTPALVEQLFLDELAALGITTGPYNLPDWEDHAEGFIRCLDSLFQHTAPTALICGEPRLFASAQQYLARRGIFSPEHVSLICGDADPTLAWCQPPMAHIAWEQRPVVQRVVRWARHIANGKDDRKQTLFQASFIEGGTIGPVPSKGHR